MSIIEQAEEARRRFQRESKRDDLSREAEEADRLAQYYQEELDRCLYAMREGTRTRWDCEQDDSLADRLREARNFQRERASQLRSEASSL